MKMIEFVKMHGLGNDYVYVDCTKENLENPSKIARRISDRQHLHASTAKNTLIFMPQLYHISRRLTRVLKFYDK